MIYKIIGIGAGSNNLSVFALTQRINREGLLILERNDSIKWHHGMMIDGATLQNNIAKDLVTLADPTSEYSILKYLHEKKRIYEFISHNNRLYRKEYEDYLNWVAAKLNNVNYCEDVIAIAYFLLPIMPLTNKVVFNDIMGCNNGIITKDKFLYLCLRNNKIKRNLILYDKLHFKEVNILNLTNAIGVK